MKVVEMEIKIAMEKLRGLTEKSDLKFELVLTDDILTIKFDKEPTQRAMELIRELVFFTNEVVVTNIESLVKQSGNNIIVSFKNYPVFCRVLAKLEDLKCKVHIVELKSMELIFDYILSEKHDLNDTELQKIQEIVNPDVADHDSIRVCYNNGVSSMCIDLLKTRAHYD